MFRATPEPAPESDEPAWVPTVTEANLREWRYQYLARLGFAGALLDVLADHVDVHAAEKLIRKGCPHDTAARILL